MYLPPPPAIIIIGEEVARGGVVVLIGKRAVTSVIHKAHPPAQRLIYNFGVLRAVCLTSEGCAKSCTLVRVYSGLLNAAVGAVEVITADNAIRVICVIFLRAGLTAQRKKVVMGVIACA